MSDDKVYISPKNGWANTKSIQETETEVIIPVVGIPFGSPEDKDFHGEYFDKGTDVGPYQEVMVYFNHNSFLPANDTPEELEKAFLLARAFRGEILGMAQKDETTEDGVIYNIVLDKRKRYTAALREMIENNLLDVSSGSKYRENDTANKGRISKWHTVEISLTPSPANPNAVPLTKSILAEALEETNMPKQAKEETTDVVESAEIVDESSVPDDVKSAFAELKTKQEEVPVVTVEQFDELKAQNEALASELAEIKSLIKSVQATLPYMVKQFGEIFQQEANKSTFEVTATKPMANSAPRPAPAPNKRPIFGDKGPVVMKAPGV